MSNSPPLSASPTMRTVEDVIENAVGDPLSYYHGIAVRAVVQLNPRNEKALEEVRWAIGSLQRIELQLKSKKPD